MHYIKSSDIKNQEIELQQRDGKKKQTWVISFDDKAHRYVLWIKKDNVKKIEQVTTSIEIEKLIAKIH